MIALSWHGSADFYHTVPGRHIPYDGNGRVREQVYETGWSRQPPRWYRIMASRPLNAHLTAWSGLTLAECSGSACEGIIALVLL